MSLIDENFSLLSCKFMYFLQYQRKGGERTVNINQTIKICWELCTSNLFHLLKY